MPDPYFSSNGVTQYCGDNLEVIKMFPDNSVDTIITDPPYSLYHFKGERTINHLLIIIGQLLIIYLLICHPDLIYIVLVAEILGGWCMKGQI